MAQRGQRRRSCAGPAPLDQQAARLRGSTRPARPELTRPTIRTPHTAEGVPMSNDRATRPLRHAEPVRRESTATPEQVWAVIADGWTYPSWVVGAPRMRAGAPDWPVPGAELHHSFGLWPAMVNDKTVSLRCERLAVWSWRLMAGRSVRRLSASRSSRRHRGVISASAKTCRPVPASGFRRQSGNGSGVRRAPPRVVGRECTPEDAES